jgi:hypothetical protein
MDGITGGWAAGEKYTWEHTQGNSDNIRQFIQLDQSLLYELNGYER